MLNLNLTSDIKELKGNLEKFQKRKLPNATKIAINETLELVKKGEQLEMKRKFQGGATSWTLRSLRIFKAGTKNLLKLKKLSLKSIDVSGSIIFTSPPQNA